MTRSRQPRNDAPGGRRPDAPVQNRPPRPTPAGKPQDRPEARSPRTTDDRPAKTARLRATPEKAVLWGFHAVLEALRSPRRKPLRLLATAAAAERLQAEIAARGVPLELLTTAEIDACVPRDAVHQGLVLEARPLEDLDIDDIPDQGTVLVLDQITDPHNVGAMVRSAAAFGVVALVTTERHAPEMTGVLAKSASGGLEHLPVVSVVNLARALDALARRGYQLVGLDSEGSVPLDDVEPAAALALVLGAEGKGLRRLTRERCDVVARLDMPGPIKSLNVSNACAVALSMLRRRGADGR